MDRKTGGKVKNMAKNKVESREKQKTGNIKDNRVIWRAIWEQSDYDGRTVRIEEEYPSKEEAEIAIDKLRRSAREINRYFRLVSIEQIEGK